MRSGNAENNGDAGQNSMVEIQVRQYADDYVDQFLDDIGKPHHGNSNGTSSPIRSNGSTQAASPKVLTDLCQPDESNNNSEQEDLKNLLSSISSKDKRNYKHLRPDEKKQYKEGIAISIPILIIIYILIVLQYDGFAGEFFFSFFTAQNAALGLARFIKNVFGHDFDALHQVKEDGKLDPNAAWSLPPWFLVLSVYLAGGGLLMDLTAMEVVDKVLKSLGMMKRKKDGKIVRKYHVKDAQDPNFPKMIKEPTNIFNLKNVKSTMLAISLSQIAYIFGPSTDVVAVGSITQMMRNANWFGNMGDNPETTQKIINGIFMTVLMLGGINYYNQVTNSKIVRAIKEFWKGRDSIFCKLAQRSRPVFFLALIETLVIHAQRAGIFALIAFETATILGIPINVTNILVLASAASAFVNSILSRSSPLFITYAKPYEDLSSDEEKPVYFPNLNHLKPKGVIWQKATPGEKFLCVFIAASLALAFGILGYILHRMMHQESLFEKTACTLPFVLAAVTVTLFHVKDTRARAFAYSIHERIGKKFGIHPDPECVKIDGRDGHIDDREQVNGSTSLAPPLVVKEEANKTDETQQLLKNDKEGNKTYARIMQWGLSTVLPFTLAIPSSVALYYGLSELEPYSHANEAVKWIVTLSYVVPISLGVFFTQLNHNLNSLGHEQKRKEERKTGEDVGISKGIQAFALHNNINGQLLRTLVGLGSAPVIEYYTHKYISGDIPSDVISMFLLWVGLIVAIPNGAFYQVEMIEPTENLVKMLAKVRIFKKLFESCGCIERQKVDSDEVKGIEKRQALEKGENTSSLEKGEKTPSSMYSRGGRKTL